MTDDQDDRRARLLRRYSLLAASTVIFSTMEFEDGDEDSAYQMAVANALGLLREIERHE